MTEKENEELLRILSDPRLERKLEREFLRKLANTPRREWTDSDLQTITMAMRDSGFLEALASRATDIVKRRLKARPGDRVLWFLGHHWKALDCPNPNDVAGLREWHPLVVLKLFEYIRRQGREEEFPCGGTKWFEKRRQELHLTPKLPYTVTKLPDESLLRCLVSSVPNTRYTYLRV